MNANINVGDMPDTPTMSRKDFLTKMISKLGRDEAVKRIAWHQSAQVSDVEILVDQVLNDDYVDEEGVKGGDSFWGPL